MEKMKKLRAGKSLLILLLGLSLVGVGVAAAVAFTLSTNVTFTKTQTTLSWWNDLARTSPIGATLSLGSVMPNSTVTKTIYIYNSGSTTVTLNMTTSGYTSSTVGNDLTVTWNREGYTLTPGGQVSAVITIQINDEIYTSGDFDLKVNAIV